MLFVVAVVVVDIFVEVVVVLFRFYAPFHH